jgi:hypothetical protein
MTIWDAEMWGVIVVGIFWLVLMLVMKYGLRDFDL